MFRISNFFLKNLKIFKTGAVDHFFVANLDFLNPLDILDKQNHGHKVLYLLY